MSFNPDNTTISGLTDASIDQPDGSHFLKYDSDSDKWVNEQPVIESVGGLSGALDAKAPADPIAGLSKVYVAQGDTLPENLPINTLVVEEGADDTPGGANGVPAGGTTGQVLAKASEDDYATEWVSTLGEVAIGDVDGLQTALDSKLAKKNAVVELTDSTADNFARVNITDDASSTSSWTDRLAFYFSGTRTGYFNEYGELRARSAKDNTVAFQAFPSLTASDDSNFFQLARTDSTDAIVSVSKKYIDTQDATKRNTYNVASTDGYITRTDLNYTVGVNEPEIHQVRVNGVKTSWQNEWGALRGISHHSWGDALVRAIRQDSDAITGTDPMMTAFEISDRRGGSTNKMWGRSWVDGSLIRNNNVMADVYVIENGATPPSTLPAGTVIIELSE